MSVQLWPNSSTAAANASSSSSVHLSPVVVPLWCAATIAPSRSKPFFLYFSITNSHVKVSKLVKDSICSSFSKSQSLKAWTWGGEDQKHPANSSGNFLLKAPTLTKNNKGSSPRLFSTAKVHSFANTSRLGCSSSSSSFLQNPKNKFVKEFRNDSDVNASPRRYIKPDTFTIFKIKSPSFAQIIVINVSTFPRTLSTVHSTDRRWRNVLLSQSDPSTRLVWSTTSFQIPNCSKTPFMRSRFRFLDSARFLMSSPRWESKARLTASMLGNLSLNSSYEPLFLRTNSSTAAMIPM